MTIESLAVVIIVLAFALRAVHQLLPSLSRSVIDRVRRLFGLKVATMQASGCDAGCGPCTGCGAPKSAANTKEAPLSFERQPRR